MVNFCFLSKMPKVSLVGIDFQHFSPYVMLPLADMKSLKRLEISTNRAQVKEISCDENIPKLHVTSLKCDRLGLVNFCSPDSLEILQLKVGYPTGIDEAVDKLKQYRKLRQVSFEFYFYAEESDEVDRFSRFIPNTVQDSSSIELPAMVKRYGFRKFLHRLEIEEFCKIGEYTEGFVNRILKLTELTSLELHNVPAHQIGIFLNGLPNLKHFVVASEFSMFQRYEPLVNVKTSYNR